MVHSDATNSSTIKALPSCRNTRSDAVIVAPVRAKRYVRLEADAAVARRRRVPGHESVRETIEIAREGADEAIGASEQVEIHHELVKLGRGREAERLALLREEAAPQQLLDGEAGAVEDGESAAIRGLHEPCEARPAAARLGNHLRRVG